MYTQVLTDTAFYYFTSVSCMISDSKHLVQVRTHQLVQLWLQSIQMMSCRSGTQAAARFVAMSETLVSQRLRDRHGFPTMPARVEARQALFQCQRPVPNRCQHDPVAFNGHLDLLIDRQACGPRYAGRQTHTQAVSPVPDIQGRAHGTAPKQMYKHSIYIPSGWRQGLDVIEQPDG